MFSKRTRSPTVDIYSREAAISPIATLRALIASRFAAAIAAATPDACTALQDKFSSATSAKERTILSGAVSLISSRQEQLAAQVERSLHQRFTAKLECPDDAISHTGKFSTEALLLIEELGMQEELELEHWVNRLREQCRAELFMLSVRLRRVLGRNSLPESHNPVFPRVLLRALKDALTHLGGDALARRAAFHAYGPLLSTIITDIYLHAGAMLAEVEPADKADSSGRHTRSGRKVSLLDNFFPPALAGS